MAEAISIPRAINVIASGLPSFVPPPGTFAEFTLNTPADAMTPAGIPGYWQIRILETWCGAAFISDFGTRGAIAYHGGGIHSVDTDYGGVLVLDIGAQSYTYRCKNSVTPTHIAPEDQQISGSSPTGDWGEFVDDGSPQTKHPYNAFQEMPTAWGGGPQGSLVRVAHTGGVSWSLPMLDPTHWDHGHAATWKFDLSQSLDGVTRLTGTNTYDYGSGTPANTNDAPGTGIDYLREGWWSYGRDNASGFGSRIAFTDKNGNIFPTIAQPATQRWGTVHHFADLDELVIISGGLPSSIKICTAGGTWTNCTKAGNWTPLDGNGGTITGVYAGYAGFKWSTILGCFVALKFNQQPLPNIEVLKIIPPSVPSQRKTGDWTLVVETVVPASAPFTSGSITVATDQATKNGSWGKLLECPSLRSFVWTKSSSAKGQLIRLQGM